MIVTTSSLLCDGQRGLCDSTIDGTPGQRIGAIRAQAVGWSRDSGADYCPECTVERRALDTGATP